MKLSTVNSLVVLLAIVTFSCNEPKKENKIMIYQDEKTETGLKTAIYRLIEPDENFGMPTLDAIYNDDMEVIMIGNDEKANIFDKDAFKKLIAAKLEGDNRKNNTWAKFISLSVNDDNGHIVVKRRINLEDDEQKEITVILDFVWKDQRWQITREVILT